MNLEMIQNKIITIQGQAVILDSDVAELYGVETKRVNEAVKNNPEKFPEGYIITVKREIKDELVENFDRFNRIKHSTAMPTAFTEKGLYMLATILKSPTATETTLAIIETFAKVKELSRTISEIGNQTDKEVQKSMLQRTGEIISNIINPSLEITETETSIKLNFALLSLEHTVKKSPKKEE